MEEKKIEMRICDSCKRQFYSFTQNTCLLCRNEGVMTDKDIIEFKVAEALDTTEESNTHEDYPHLEDSANISNNSANLLVNIIGLLYEKGFITRGDVEEKLLKKMRG